MSSFSAGGGGGVSVEESDYTDLAGSRSLDTVYTNGSDRPMLVFVDVGQEDGQGGPQRVTFIGQIEGPNGTYETSKFDSGQGHPNGSYESHNIPIQMVVGPGLQYQVVNYNGYFPEVKGWFEVTL